MINSYDELQTVEQELFCISFIGEADGVKRVCYLTKNGRPVVFFNLKSAQNYFECNDIATSTDRYMTWGKLFKGELLYPQAKIIKIKVSNFEIVGERHE